MDLFFWRYIKDILYSEWVKSFPIYAEELQPLDALSRVWGDVEFRSDICTADNGVHIELH
jgi:hypothetical protein